MKEKAEILLEAINKRYLWDEMPVFCFTSDIDWASEDVMDAYFESVNTLDIKPTVFVTHESKLIADNFNAGKISRGIHPNFLENSSHGKTFREVVETCKAYAPESRGFRSHRAFDVTDITHLLERDYGYRYLSNLITNLQIGVRPVLHESGMIHFPVFFEDGTHLYNKMDLDIKTYKRYFDATGLKIISFHPMNFVFNSPSMSFMRGIKDSLTRDEYQNISRKTIVGTRNQKEGIGRTILDIVEYVKRRNYPIYSFDALYAEIITQAGIVD